MTKRKRNIYENPADRRWMRNFDASSFAREKPTRELQECSDSLNGIRRGKMKMLFKTELRYRSQTVGKFGNLVIYLNLCCN